MTQDRRGFLASVLATVPVGRVLPSLPPSRSRPAVAPPPSVPRPGLPTHYFAAMEEIGGKLYPDAIVGGSLDAGDRPIRRFTFIPLELPKRFTTAVMRWHPNNPMLEALEKNYKARERNPTEPSVTDEQFIAIAHDWRATVGKNIRHPVSLVDVLDTHNGADAEWLDVGDMLIMRDEAFADAAAENESQLAETDDVIGMEWHVVIELGQPVLGTLAIIHVERNGVGCLARDLQWPVRIIRPTAAEQASWPLPASV